MLNAKRFRQSMLFPAACAATIGIGVSACGGDSSGDGWTTRRADVDLVSLEAANTPGDSPWTPSVTSADPPQQVNRVDTPNASRTVSGDQIGLYGGSIDRVVCDRDKLIGYLKADPAKAAAWQRVTGSPDLRSYILGLSPVFLTKDTHLTNHGFDNGKVTTFPAVLQTGTAVLVDNRGLPRVRCDSGSPLGQPRGDITVDSYSGTGWQNLDAESIVAVEESEEPVTDLKVIPIADEGPWAAPTQTSAPIKELVFSVVLGDATAVPAPDVTLPTDVTLQTVDVTQSIVTSTDVTSTVTSTVSTTATTTETTTVSSSTPTTETEPTDTETAIEPGGLIDPGSPIVEPAS